MAKIKNIIQVYTDESYNTIISNAAKITGLNMAAFCRSASLKEARQILKQNSPEVSAN